LKLEATGALRRNSKFRSSKLDPISNVRDGESSKLRTPSHLDHSLFGNLNLFRIGKPGRSFTRVTAIFDIRIFAGLALLLLVLACCFSSSSNAATAATPLEVGVIGSNDRADYTVWENDQQPAQDNDNSSDSTSDLDDSDGGSDDVTAAIFARHNQPFSARHTQLAQTFGVHPSIVFPARSPGTVPDFLLSTQSLTCLHDRIRERAPPHPVSRRSQA
jgi:hypothetical protein